MRRYWKIPVTDPERRDDPEALVHVVRRLLPAQDGRDVHGEVPALADGVLRVRHGAPARQVRGEVRDGGVVARRPGVGHRRVPRADPQVRPDHQVPALVDREVRVPGDHRVGGVAGRPDDQLGVELLAGREHHVPVHGGDQLGVQVHVRAAGLEVADHPPPGPSVTSGRIRPAASTRWKLRSVGVSSG